MENEIQYELPNYSKKRIIIIVVTLLLIILGIYLYSPFFPLENIKVLGNNDFTMEQIIAKGQIDTSKNIYLISAKDIEQNMLKDPYIQSVKVRKLFPRSISIEIYIREPIATISFTGGFALIDADFQILKIQEDFANTVKPLVIGVDVSALNVGEKLDIEDEKSAMVMIAIKNVQGLGLIQNLTQINVSDLRNISLLTTQGITVLLGDGEAMNDRLLKLNQILVDLHTKGISSGYVDMRFEAYPVYRQG